MKFIPFIFDILEAHLGISGRGVGEGTTQKQKPQNGQSSSLCVKLMYSFFQRESGYPIMTSLMNSEIH